MPYHVLIVYRNFLSKSGPASHVGLGINALQTAKTLRIHGVLADAQGVWTAADIVKALQSQPSITHCVIEAPWVATADLEALIRQFPRIEFTERCHSQIGFLQVEAGAIKLFRDAALVEAANLNFTLSANSDRFAAFFTQAYLYPCVNLPNLYDTSRPATWRHHNPGNPLKLASFGALRLLKNHTTAAAAALLIGRRRRQNIEFSVNVNREEHGKGILASLANMFAGLTWAKLIQVPWSSWAEFSTLVAQQDLCFQLSFTETFNLVTANAAAALVPSVVGEAIDWVPASWVAPEDSPEAAAEIGCNLLANPHAGQQGQQALVAYVETAVVKWKQWLTATAGTAGMNLPPLT